MRLDMTSTEKDAAHKDSDGYRKSLSAAIKGLFKQQKDE